MALASEELRTKFLELPGEIQVALRSHKLGPEYPLLAARMIETEQSDEDIRDEIRLLIAQIGGTPIDSDPEELIRKLAEYVLAAMVASEGEERKGRARGATAMLRSEVLAKSDRMRIWVQMADKEKVQEVEAVQRSDKRKKPCRCRRQRKLRKAEGDEELRSKVEEEEKTRWSKELAAIIEEANMPRFLKAMRTFNPEGSMARCAGASRASTIRQRIRYWRKARFWLMAVHGEAWPSRPERFVDFVEALWEGGCPRTNPQSILSAMAYIEEAGEVEENSRISTSHFVTSTVNSISTELARGAAPTKKASGFRQVLMVSLELYIVDDSNQPYLRAFAWVRLVKVWASLRSDDLGGMLPEELQRLDTGLKGLLDRTKTSGPGKRVRWLSIWIDEDAWITERRWLDIGLAIWRQPEFAFERDYFLGPPNEDFSAPRKRPIDYIETDALNKRLLKELWTPVYDESSKRWSDSGRRLIEDELEKFWTEHSERSYVNSMAACLGFAKEERNYLGRWMPEQSDDYLLTSRAIVGKLQRAVAKALREGNPLIDESESMLKMRDFMKKLGFGEERISNQEERLEFQRVSDGTETPPPTEDEVEQWLRTMRSSNMLVTDDQSNSIDELRWGFYRIQQADQEEVEELEAPEPEGPEAPPYIINFSTKRKVATIHLYNGCWRKIGRDLKNYQYLYDLADASEEAEFCKDCCPENWVCPQDTDSSSSTTDGTSSEDATEGLLRAVSKVRTRSEGSSKAKAKPKPKSSRR